MVAFSTRKPVKSKTAVNFAHSLSSARWSVKKGPEKRKHVAPSLAGVRRGN